MFQHSGIAICILFGGGDGIISQHFIVCVRVMTCDFWRQGLRLCTPLPSPFCVAVVTVTRSHGWSVNVLRESTVWKAYRGARVEYLCWSWCVGVVMLVPLSMVVLMVSAYIAYRQPKCTQMQSRVYGSKTIKKKKQLKLNRYHNAFR